MLVAQSCPTLGDTLDCSPPGSCPWHFPGKNTGVGCHFLLQGIFPEELGSPALQADLSQPNWTLVDHSEWVT